MAFIAKIYNTILKNIYLHHALKVAFKIFLLESPHHFLVSFSSEANDSITVLSQNVQDIHGILDQLVFFGRDLKKKRRVREQSGCD